MSINMPAKTDLTGNPSVGTFKIALGQLYDFTKQYLPSDGSKPTAANVAYTPHGNIVSTDVQAALSEVGDKANTDVAGGLIDRLNTVVMFGVQPTVSGANVTVAQGTVMVVNCLTGKYAWIREGTYALGGGYKVLGVNWDLTTNYGSGAGQGIVPAVYDYTSPVARPHKNIIPLMWMPTGNTLHLAASWQYPPFAP